VAKRLARRLGYRLLDTGALYRSVALVARRQGVAWDDEAGLAEVARGLRVDFAFSHDAGHGVGHAEPGGDEQNEVFIDGDNVSEAIRTPEMSDGASRVSALPGVRAALLELQRRLGAEGGVVVEGRDVGTVVFPQAQAKFFLTASDEERARRRVAELLGRGQAVSLADTLAEMRARDQRDSSRAISPLRQAEDALLVDSSGAPVDEVVARLEAEVRRRATDGA
jgi:cytidylate kinase